MTHHGVGVAIVGPGAIGDVHATALATSGIPLLAVAGPVQAEREEFGAKHGVPRVYADLDEVLGDDDIHGVIIATPSHLHASQAIRALAAGRHVLAEIPVGLSLAEAEAVAKAADQAGRIAAVGHTLRYWEPHRRLQAMLAERQITPTQVVIRSMLLRQSNMGWTGRLRDWTDSVLWHHGGHAVDAALWHLCAAGAVQVAGACGAAWPGNGTTMDFSTTLITEDRRLASVSLSYHSRMAMSDFLVIAPEHTLYVTGATLLLDGEVVYDGGDVAATQTRAVQAQDLAFIQAVAGGPRPDVTVSDVLPAMAALQKLADAA